ncbi:hypothetical protein LP420_28785 [Massilia sp. B-10]|nr:hypothetical protein LP420_28785 [Massilia sp. B-10]
MKTCTGYEAKGRGSNTAVYGSTDVIGHYLPGGSLFIEDCPVEADELPNAYIDPSTGEVRRSTAVDWTWQDWQPVFTTSLTGTISAVNLQARYFKVGKKITIRLSFQVSGTGTGFIGVTLPFAAVGPASFSAVEDTTMPRYDGTDPHLRSADLRQIDDCPSLLHDRHLVQRPTVCRRRRI